MEIDNKNLGQRLRSLRESRKVTQQELELSIDAAFGHISRIESGHLNPTKETLQKISQFLNLNIKETLLLLGLNLNSPARNEIEDVIKDSKEYLNASQNPVYIADDFWFVWWTNEKVLDLINLPQDTQIRSQFMKEKAGIHVLEWLFDKRLGVRQKMPAERWPKIALNQCCYFIGLIDYHTREKQEWVQDLLKKLKRTDNFDTIWSQALEKYDSHINREELSVTYYLGNDWVEFFIANSRINQHPRFMIVEYLPCFIYKNGDEIKAIKLKYGK